MSTKKKKKKPKIDSYLDKLEFKLGIWWNMSKYD